MLLQARPQPAIDRAAMAARVRAEFQHSWDGYKKHAWGHDELLPLSHKARDWHEGATLLMTPLDALDTMLIMGMKEEARKTQEFISANLSFDRDVSVQNFEITIRTLGGLLSVYQMTGDARMLAKADLEMGRMFLDSLEKYCRTDSGYTVLRSVVTKEKGDRMHSFWLAETLKYLYLLYQPDAIDFDQIVFNTEAHPLRRVKEVNRGR